VIILGGKAWLWLGGVACASVVERHWIIFCYTAQVLVRFGVSFLSCLELLGDVRVCSGSVGVLEELVWKTLFGDLESYV
jgi:uncharacterized membrane protein YccF (DUF307 family)